MRARGAVVARRTCRTLSGIAHWGRAIPHERPALIARSGLCRQLFLRPCDARVEKSYRGGGTRTREVLIHAGFSAVARTASRGFTVRERGVGCSYPSRCDRWNNPLPSTHHPELARHFARARSTQRFCTEEQNPRTQMVRDSVTDDEETTMRLSTPTRADLRRPRNSKGCDDSAHFAGGKERRIARSQAVLAVLFALLSILTPQPARGVPLSELLSEGDLIAGDKRFSSFVLNFAEEDPPPVFDDIFCAANRHRTR